MIPKQQIELADLVIKSKFELRENMYVTLAAFLQVIMVDILLSYPLIFGASLIFLWIPQDQMRKTIIFSCLIVLLIKICMTSIVISLFSVVGITLLFSLATLYISCVQFRRLVVRSPDNDRISAKRGIVEISIAAIGLSFASTLGIAGAWHHMGALVLGVFVSTAILVLAGFLLSKLQAHARELAWVALFLLVFFALRDAYEGVNGVLGHTLPNIPF